MKKTLWTMLAMAAALSASAVEVELLKDGQGTEITANWTNPDNRFGIWTDNDNVASWFRATYEESTLSQSVTLSDCGISAEEIQAGMTMTASATVFTYGSGGSYGDGSRICNVKVYEYDANGTVLAVNTVMDKPGVLFDATTFTTNFTLNPDTRSVKYEMNGQDVVNWQNLYGPAFRNCSMKVTRNSGAYNVTFVSTGTTLEGSLDRPPVASRSGDYTFLGYFTEDGVQVFDANYALVESGLSQEAPDWIHNEERNLKNPSSEGYPTKYKGLNYLSGTLRDNGGVHRNSTVLSHAAYLMWNGIDGKQSMRIGTETLGKLLLNALEQFEPNVTFQKAAVTIYKTARTMGLSRDQVECVAQAFKYAELPVRDKDKAATSKEPTVNVLDAIG